MLNVMGADGCMPDRRPDNDIPARRFAMPGRLKNISRRSFLKGAAAGSAVLAAPCVP